jgi:hypothetical protein
VSVPAAPEPDDKDWTWVAEKACADCGFDPAGLRREDIARVLMAAGARWEAVLAGGDVRTRPAPAVWSPLEYACHCRDVCDLFTERTRLMLDDDDPLFANWDQDVTALEKRYWEADPAVVSREITTAAGAAAEVFAGIRGAQWARTGRRSNGSVFTVESLGRYFVHDIVHHLHDVGAAPEG